MAPRNVVKQGLRFGRREFICGGLAITACASAPNARAGGALDAYRRAFVIDSLSIDGPATDPAPVIAAGMTAAVLDLQMYPRNQENATAALQRWNDEFARAGSPYLKVLRAADIVAAKNSSRFGVILACQDAAILGVSTWSVNAQNIKNLENFHAQGLRVLQLTHNDRNAVGDSYQEKTNAGLSRLGEAVVTNMNRLRMMVDLSHCGDRTTLETIALSSRPCAITHASCRSLLDTGRAKTDAVVRALARKGGFFGVFNMSMWLTEEDVPTIEHVVNHIDHAVQVAGIEQVGFGSDGALNPTFDPEASLTGMRAYVRRTHGIPGSERIPNHVVVQELASVDRMQRLAMALGRRGYSDDAVEKIVGGNFKRIFAEVCG